MTVRSPEVTGRVYAANDNFDGLHSACPVVAQFNLAARLDLNKKTLPCFLIGLRVELQHCRCNLFQWMVSKPVQLPWKPLQDFFLPMTLATAVFSLPNYCFWRWSVYIIALVDRSSGWSVNLVGLAWLRES